MSSPKDHRNLESMPEEYFRLDMDKSKRIREEEDNQWIWPCFDRPYKQAYAWA